MTEWRVATVTSRLSILLRDLPWSQAAMGGNFKCSLSHHVTNQFDTSMTKITKIYNILLDIFSYYLVHVILEILSPFNGHHINFYDVRSHHITFLLGLQFIKMCTNVNVVRT